MSLFFDWGARPPWRSFVDRIFRIEGGLVHGARGLKVYDCTSVFFIVGTQTALISFRTLFDWMKTSRIVVTHRLSNGRANNISVLPRVTRTRTHTNCQSTGNFDIDQQERGPTEQRKQTPHAAVLVGSGSS